MKKLKILSIILFILAITLILCGSGISFAYEVDSSIQDRDKIILTIEEEYVSYNSFFSQYGEKVLLFNQSIASYYGELEKTNINTIQVLNEIEVLVESLKNSKNIIVEQCSRLPNNDYQYSGLCSTVSDKYNTVLASYSEMIEGYNTLLTEYNSWALIQAKEELELYNSELYNEYVELNNK